MEVYGRYSFSKLPIEWVCWVSALFLLYFSNPHTHHFSLCPLDNVGIAWCPGCGLGRSIALLMHGELQESIRMHRLGIPAFLVIVHRIYNLSRRTYSIWIKT
ncbi:DUF2752 domain-containing protein [Parapedobacter sp.]|uniref:DUF2752 domain-containing protein n=1 Tax=Parapedobacter sp. TaxID=1958893 RepID=UPI002D805ED4|nr:DUF2752 domain-containing protein [Parapedobacter sp.]